MYWITVFKPTCIWTSSVRCLSLICWIPAWESGTTLNLTATLPAWCAHSLIAKFPASGRRMPLWNIDKPLFYLKVLTNDLYLQYNKNLKLSFWRFTSEYLCSITSDCKNRLCLINFLSLIISTYRVKGTAVYKFVCGRWI